MGLRDIRQEEFANKWIEEGMFGILFLASRFGKCRVAINIFNKLKPTSILIAYPDSKIRESWDNEFKILGHDTSIVTFTTHMSLKKHIHEKYDIIVLDEIHLLSNNQMNACKEIFKLNSKVLGLSGTLSHSTIKTLSEELKLRVTANYTIEQAIREGVIADYEISVVKVPLDNVTLKRYGRFFRTEKQQFDKWGRIIDAIEEKGGNSKFARLNRMRIIQNSAAKLNKTKEFLQLYTKERILVFCGLISVADKLGIASHHSKSGNKKRFEEFLNGDINQLAVCRIGNTGVTYTPLNRIIINYFDSNSENLCQKLNRAMSMEYDNPEKIAKIIIISTNENVELSWLRRALEFFDKSKITYI